MVRIVLADGHPIIRTGLRHILTQEADFSVVGEAATSQEACQLCAELRPHVMLLSLNLPDTEPTAILTNLCLNCPQTRILMLTDDLSRQTIHQAITLGVSGYLHKREAANDLVQALRVVAQDGQWFSDPVLNRLVQRTKPALPQSGKRNFSKRKRQVLQLLARAKTDQEISLLLNIQPRTVRLHTNELRCALGLETRTELVIWAVEAGYNLEIG